MTVKLIILFGLVVVSTVVVLGAPRALSSDVELKKSVIEFLKQDKDFLTQYEKIRALGTSEGMGLRTRRQTEIDVNTSDTESIDGEEKPGFFDRAAKFIVDLLQRFLKWINTDGN